MLKNLNLFPMTSAKVKDETTLHRSMDHLAKFEEIVERIKTDLVKKHPEQMDDLSSAYPSNKVQENYHFISYQLSLKRNFTQLQRFLNTNTAQIF